MGNTPCIGTISCDRVVSGECTPNYKYKDACPTGEWKTNWFCSGNWRYRIYGEMGCSGGECFSWSKNEWEYCGSNSYGSWSYYCSGNEVHRSRIIYYRGCSKGSCYSDWDIEIDYDVKKCGTSGYEYRILGDWQQRSYVERGCKDGSCYTKYGPWVNYLQDCGHTCLNHGTASVAWPDCSCQNVSPKPGYEKIGTWNTYDCGNNCTGYKKVGGDCPCTGWVNGSCGGGSCSATQRQHTRTCTPSGCDIESKCVSDSACVTPAPT
ncbi:MAG: hypothetical protein Q8N87_00355, partial [bacterium]|nr:hypothetical protein [bacterium]